MNRWLSLLRWKNLLMVAVTQSMVWWVLPTGIPPIWSQILLVLSTGCITAGGYLINDWYDVEIDAVNKPQKAFLGSAAPKKSAWQVWILLSIMGLLLAVLPAIAAGMRALVSLQIITILLLWWYAAKAKCLPLIGNILVALLTALSVELPQFYVENTGISGLAVDFLALFALALTLIREIVKDLQDEAGDLACGCKTLPIVAGRTATVWIATVLGSLLFGATLFAGVVITYLPSVKGGIFIGFLLFGAVATPLLVWMKRLWRSYTPREYGASSHLLKAIMIAGIAIFFLTAICLPSFISP